MIKHTDNRADIISLWMEAFGDSEEEVIFFLDNAIDKECIACYDNDEMQAMLFLVKCNFGKYIYCACTAKKHRGKGIMSELLAFCKKNETMLCLIPANDGLVDFYQQRGFDIKLNINDLQFHQSEEVNEYLFEGYQLSEPVALMWKG